MRRYLGSKGFTLVEVLVASIILFSAIGIGSMVLRTALSQLNRVSYTARIATALYMVKDLVREDLEQNRLEGKGEWGKDVAFQWKAEPLQSVMNTFNNIYVEELAQEGKFRLTLYKMKLTLWEKASAFKPRSFTYKELIYQKAAQ